MTLFLLLASLAGADEVTLKSGKKFTGIAREEGDKVILEMAIGTVGIPKDQISSVTFGPTPLHEFYEKLKACSKAGDLAALAHAEKIPRLAAVAWAKVIELDPENAEARKALGHEKVDGQWTTRQEREERTRAASEATERKALEARLAQMRQEREEIARIEADYRRRIAAIQRAARPEPEPVYRAYPWDYSFFHPRVAPAAAAGVALWTPLWYPECCPLREPCVRRAGPASGPGAGFNTPYYGALYSYYSSRGGP